MQHEVSNDRVERPVVKRHGFRGCLPKLDLGMEPTSHRQHRFGEVYADDYCSAFGGRGSDKPRASSHIKNSVSFAHLHFVEQWTDGLAHERAEPVHVGRSAPGPCGVLKSGDVLRIEPRWCHSVFSFDAGCQGAVWKPSFRDPLHGVPA